MKNTWFWLLVALAAVVGALVYRSRSGNDLNVEPHAAQEIDKARRR